MCIHVTDLRLDKDVVNPGEKFRAFAKLENWCGDTRKYKIKLGIAPGANCKGSLTPYCVDVPGNGSVETTAEITAPQEPGTYTCLFIAIYSPACVGEDPLDFDYKQFSFTVQPPPSPSPSPSPPPPPLPTPPGGISKWWWVLLIVAVIVAVAAIIYLSRENNK